MRLRIIGASGSGKTFLAQKLSRLTNVPCCDLDKIFWDNSDSYSQKRDEDSRNKMFCEVIEKDEWIIEGVQYAWTQRSFSDADNICLLNPPKFLCRLRIVRRYILRKLRRTGRKNENLKSLIALLKWTKKFYKVNLPQIRTVLEQYKEKAVELKSRKEVNRFIKNMRNNSTDG